MKKLKLYYWITMLLYVIGLISFLALVVASLVNYIGSGEYRQYLLWSIAALLSMLVASLMAWYSINIKKIDWDSIQKEKG